MPSIAELGILVDSRDTLRAETNLEKMTKAAKGTEKATKRLTRATDILNRKMSGVAKSAGSMVGALVSFQAMSGAIGMSRRFNSALAETGTLLSGNAGEMDELKKSAIGLSGTFGGTATAQVKAYYQAISAGSATVKDATALLDVANRLAIGGVTNVTVGVDVLSTAVNSYGSDVLTAAQASDALFVGMKAGKTTIGELGAALGNILPLSSALNVSFDETVAGVAALTTGGLTTAQAVTGLRAALTAVTGPTKQARDLAKSLGLEFNASALESKGLAGFLESVVEKSGGSAVALRTLFGSVEATTAALAFAGGAGEKFSDILEQMSGKAGATDAAFKKMSEDLSQRLTVQLTFFGNKALVVGNTLLAVLVPALEVVTTNITAIATVAAITAGAITAKLAFSLGTTLVASITTSVSQLIALEFALGATGKMAAIAGASMKVFGIALRFAGGPLGIVLGLLGGAAGYFLAFGQDAETASSGIKKAEENTAKLNRALGTFYATAAPSAGREAIALANDNRKLAATAYEAAEAELAKAKAMASAYQSNPNRIRSLVTLPEDSIENQNAVAFNNRIIAQTEALRVATEKLNFTKNKERQAITAVTGSLHGYGKKTKDANDEIVVSVKGLGKLGGAAGGAVGDLLDLTGATDTLADGLRNNLTDAVDIAANAWGTLITTFDISAVAKKALSDFVGLLAKMATAAARNRIMISLGLGGTAAGGAAGASSGGITSAATQGILGKVVGAGSALLGGIVSGGVGIVTSFAGGVTGALGGIAGGLTSAGSFLTSSVAGIATGGVAGFGAAVGAVALPLLALAAVFAIGKKLFGRSLKSGGIRGEFGGNQGFSGNEYKFYKGGWLRSDKTEMSALDAETQSGLSDAYLSIRGTTKSYIETLGLASKSIRGFKHEIDIITLGKSQEEITAQIQEQLGLAANGLATLALGTEQYTRKGETSAFTLERLATGLNVTNMAFETLGQNLYSVSLKSADAASKLVDLFGGIEGFNTATASYFDLFYSEQEKVAAITRATTKTFAEYGRILPETRNQYRAMVDSLDVTTSSGRELYTVMIGLSGAMNAILPLAGSLSAILVGLAGTVTSEIDQQTTAIADLARLSGAAAKQWYTVATTLDKLVQSMLGSDVGGTSSAQQLMANRNAYMTAFSAAKGGDVDAARDIPGLSKSYLKSALSQSRTAEEYAKSAAKIRSDIGLLSGIAGLEGANKDVLQTLYESQLDVLGELKAYILAGNIDADVLGKFSGQLGSLESAVKQAEMFSYEYLKERLKVTVDVIADASIPKHMRNLLNNAATGITSTIDFLVRSKDLTPDLKWLALQSSTTHIKTLKFLVGKELPAGVKKIAISNVSQLDKTVNLIAGSKIGHKLKAIALAGSSELSRTVLAVLGSDVSSKAMKLALGNVGSYTVAVQGALGKSVGANIRRIVFGEAGTYTAGIGAAISSKMTGSQRRILLLQQGEYIANISGVFNKDKATSATKALLLAANTTAFRVVTVRRAFAASLTKDQKALLEQKSQRATRIIEAILQNKTITGNKALFLEKFSDPLGFVTKTITGKIDLSNLTPSQKTLLSAINGTTDGKITLGGGFVFDPSKGFKNLFENKFVKPISGLRGALKALREAVRADLRYSKAIAVISKKEAKIAGLKDDQAAGVLAGQAIIDKIKALEISTGTDMRFGKGDNILYIGADGKIVNKSDGHMGGDIAGFRSEFYGEDGLQSELFASKKALNAFFNKIAKQQQILDDMKINIPGFASGGNFGGGLRVVGENGPELEFTGPSHVSSNSQAKALFDNSDVVNELRELRRETGEMRKQIVELNRRGNRDTKRAADTLEAWDKIGQPAERTA